jgi:hypothetical protein
VISRSVRSKKPKRSSGNDARDFGAE